jgi:di/tricarboxylate transporter
MVLTAGALYLFTRDRIPIEYSCLGVLLVLVLGFELFPYTVPAAATAGAEGAPAAETVVLRGVDFLLGFGNEALITICLLLILGKGVEVSGALRPLGGLLVRVWSRSRSLALLITLVVYAFISAFVNNTPLVVMTMPILIGLAHRIRMSPSRLLMPVCFATTLGGMTTTLGSSTNLLVVNVGLEHGLPRIGMFDFFLLGWLATGAGILYLWVVGPRWIPDRTSPLAGTAPRIFGGIVEIPDGSPFAGRTLGELVRTTDARTRIERVQRGALDLMRLPSLTLRPGDRLHVRGAPDTIKRIQESAGARFEVGGLRRGPAERLVEIVVTRDSPLHGKRLSELHRTTLGRLFPVGVQRSGPDPMTPIDDAGDPQLTVGDVLLMQGNARDIHELKEAHNYLVLDRTISVPRTANARLATATLVAVVVVAAFGFVPIIVSALCGVSFMLLTRCMHWDEVWSAIDTRLVLVIVTSLALGTVLSGTGATDFIAQSFVSIVEGLPTTVVLSSFLLILALLNEVVSNNALAVIATPIGISIAEQIGAPTLPFVLAVLFGANAGFITPIGYQTNLIVFRAGGYKFGDFVRVGAPLQLVVWIVLSIALPVFYL